MLTNYDKIAKIYDLLSRMVFGKNIIKAQVCMLNAIIPGSRILIVGGGTGWILDEISKFYSTGLTIDYVESSAEMIVLSRKRNYCNNTVSFINQPIEYFDHAYEYDIILTPFMFDNFKYEKAAFIFNRLSAMHKTKGLWLYADFVHNRNENRLWQKLLLNTMYLFFRLTCNIETRELADMQGCFLENYDMVSEQNFYADFIKARIYMKR